MGRSSEIWQYLPQTFPPSSPFVACTLLVLVIFFVSSLRTAFRAGLRQIPGPVAARFSGLYRASLVYGGKAPYQYRRLHEKYGPIVRVGPNHVSVSDPSAVPQIYGIGSNYLKASRHMGLLIENITI